MVRKKINMLILATYTKATKFFYEHCWILLVCMVILWFFITSCY